MTRLFVYGTLMPGRLRWPHLQPFVTAHRSAAVPGTLFDSGNGWPVAVLDGSPAAGPTVPGVLVDLDAGQLDTCLELIDEVEDTATDELRRVRVTTTGGEAAWAYHFTRSVAGLTRIADWSMVDPALEA
ncbi:gamma-glutamylcyclotransferase family protein [Desertimonas flava]|uniref:gamma-glutamylcyclotransferase family protein n=1 Tax=Desertimonas flava TaxID=2064846 RepID=UPI0013C430B5|nr:gamma-glutamylcyclotransferase [Desertimonas flava]